MALVKGGWLTLLVTLLGLSLTSPAFSATTYDVSIDTFAVEGSTGQLAFDFTSNNGGANKVDILNFSTDGTLGLPETQGGLVEGDLILGLNPAPFSRINDQFFFNELVLHFVSFGKSITFTLQLTENSPGSGQLPDEFALFLLNASGRPVFTTSDPLGPNALFAITIPGVPGGTLEVFRPTTFQPPSTLQIIVPPINQPPDCRRAVPSVSNLWPPHHEFRPVNIMGVLDPDEDPINITIDSIFQDEPVKENGTGSGNTCPDATGVGTDTAQVRAERAGSPEVPGDGRVYHISFTASDGKGGTCTGKVTVCVPHDQSQEHVCVDQGSLFNSTVCP